MYWKFHKFQEIYLSFYFVCFSSLQTCPNWKTDFHLQCFLKMDLNRSWIYIYLYIYIHKLLRFTVCRNVEWINFQGSSPVFCKHLPSVCRFLPLRVVLLAPNPLHSNLRRNLGISEVTFNFRKLFLPQIDRSKLPDSLCWASVWENSPLDIHLLMSEISFCLCLFCL